MAHRNPPFLNLPTRVRQQIYRDAGLVLGTKITLQPGINRFRERKRSNPYMYPDTADEFYREGCWAAPEQLEVTYNLLQTCRQISEEVRSLVYAQNTLVVRVEHVETGLAFLRRLPPRHCRELRDLYVELSVDFGPQGNYWGETPRDQDKFAAWKDAATHVLSNVRPGTLALHLTCDTGEGQDTLEVLRPLRDAAGCLRDCELRLDAKSNGQPVDAALVCRLSRLAAETAALVTVLRPRPTFRHFLRLPVEIRHAILRYTDLVTPYNQVQWSHDRGFSVMVRGPCRGSSCPPQRHHGCKFQCPMPLDDGGMQSFCCRWYGAYSPRCRCWTAPQPLMLVCRAMYRDAITVLYSSNRIIVTPHLPHEQSFDSTNLPFRLDASRFITRHMWPGILDSLRTVELVLPPMEPEFRPHTSRPLYLDWRFAVDHLREHADLRAMTLIIHISLPQPEKRGPSPAALLRRQIMWWGEDTAAVLKSYHRLLTPLEALRGMRRFFVFLEWPWHWTPDSSLPRYHRYPPQTSDALHATVSRMEIWLEKMVMGAEYNSGVLGKAREVPSFWLQRVWKRGVYRNPFYIEY